MGDAGARRPIWWVALVFLALVVVSCGGSSESDQTSAATGETESESAGAGQTVESDEGDPVSGGSLVVGLEAETDGWDPTANRWAPSGHFVAQAVYDNLAMFDAEGVAQPYLAESLTPNEDFTEWTVALPDGVEFHNGAPLTAEAVKVAMEAHLASGLTAPAIRPIEAVDVVDDLTAVITMSTPWASFPVALTGQVGYVAEPSTVGTDEAVLRPVGTGPFVFEEWVVDSNWKGSRNETYWQQGKPYLDAVEFKPIIDNPQRENSLVSGQIDYMHTTSSRTVEGLRVEAEAGEIQVADDAGFGEETFYMINTLAPPLDDQRVRQALAHATNRDAYVEVIDRGVRSPAASPYTERSPWHSEEAVSAYPAFDLDAAKALVEEVEAEEGPVEVTVTAALGPENREILNFLSSQWEEAGIAVTTNQIEQSQLILDALTGEYQIAGWRQFGTPDPDGDYVWWDIENANDIGTFSLNFARNRNPAIQEQLDIGRSTDDQDARKDAYDQVQTLLNEDIPYLWLSHTLWMIAADDSVRNMVYWELPDGSQGLPFYAGISGTTKLTDVWLEQ